MNPWGRCRRMSLDLPDVERLSRRLFAVLAAALLAVLLWKGLTGDGVVTAARVNCDLGVWSMRFLIATLTLSPLSRWTRRPSLKRWRRPFGLASFAFAMGHAIHYLIYAQVWPAHLHFLVVKPYLFVGCIATIMLATMAATSTNGMVRRLSPKVWRRLHTIVYLALPLSMIHGLLGFWDPYGEATVHMVACVLLAVVRWGPGWYGGAVRLARRIGAPARPAPTADTRTLT